MTRVPAAVTPCLCPACTALSAAIDRRRSAIAEGTDAEETRRAVHDAAVRTDAAHGLDRPIRRRSDVAP